MPEVKKAEKDEVVEEIDDRDVEELLAEDDSDNHQIFTLSIKQKIQLILAGVGAFILFIVILFPLEEMIRTHAGNYARNAGIFLDFKKLKIPFIGKKTIDSLNIQTQSGSNVKVEEIEINAGLIPILQGTFNGEILATSITYETLDIGLKFGSMNLNGILSGLRQTLPEYAGNINLQLTSGKIFKMPVFPVLGEIKDLQVKNASFSFKLRTGKLSIDKAVIDTSIAKIVIKGKIDLAPALVHSRIDLEICPKLTQNFALERQDIADMLQLATKENGEVCIPIQGTFGQPQIKNLLPSQSSDTNQNVGTPAQQPANPGSPQAHPPAPALPEAHR